MNPVLEDVCRQITHGCPKDQFLELPMRNEFEPQIWYSNYGAMGDLCLLLIMKIVLQKIFKSSWYFWRSIFRVGINLTPNLIEWS